MATRGILLDIEGTTSSISFVYDVMFPFVRRELNGYLDTHWEQADLISAREQLARDAGHPSFEAWCGTIAADDLEDQRGIIRTEVTRLMDADVKSTGLKLLQGLIWEAGFHTGEMQAHVYDDVPASLQAWNDQGCDVRIYSSGSIQAQRLFFGHTIAGDLLPLLRGHYDTTTGPKREAGSYTKIASEFGLSPAQVTFVSDVVAELDAARSAGMQTVLAVRPGNGAPPADHSHRVVNSFAELTA
jgi:enolase-phosphatase E1